MGSSSFLRRIAKSLHLVSHRSDNLNYGKLALDDHGDDLWVPRGCVAIYVVGKKAFKGYVVPVEYLAVPKLQTLISKSQGDCLDMKNDGPLFIASEIEDFEASLKELKDITGVKIPKIKNRKA